MGEKLTSKKIAFALCWKHFNPVLFYLACTIILAIISDSFLRAGWFVLGALVSIMMLFSLLVTLMAIKLGIEAFVKDLGSFVEKADKLIDQIKSKKK